MQKNNKNLPKSIRKKFAKEIKYLYNGKIEKINLEDVFKKHSFTVRIGYGWYEDDYASFSTDEKDIEHGLAKIQNNIYKYVEDFALKKSVEFTKEIKDFNSRFEAECSAYNVDSYEEFQSIINEFNISENKFLLGFNIFPDDMTIEK